MGTLMADQAKLLDHFVNPVRQFAYGPHSRKTTVRPTIGLALGGGFARGIAHVGVLRVFEENKIPIDFLAGTSVGALIAAAYAGGSTLDEMEHTGRSTRFKDFAEWTISRQGLATDSRLKRYLRRLTPLRRFEDCRIPLAIVATDVLTTKPVYFTKGEIGPALCASCAYPGLFRPVEREGRLLVDGFLTSPVPVDAVRRMGANFVVGVNLSGISSDERPTNMLEIVSRSFSILLRSSEAAWRPLADLVIEPDVEQFRWDDFPRTPDLIAAGERAARKALPQILEAIRTPKPLDVGKPVVPHS